MDADHVLMNRHFWYSYLSCAFGVNGPEFDPAVLGASFHVSDSDARAWWDAFTSSYDGVIDQADGHVASEHVDLGIPGIPEDRSTRYQRRSQG